MKTFYHSNDLDGLCSGAIVKHFNPETELIGIDYGTFDQQELLDSIEEGEDVFIVDFCIEPFDWMEKIKKKAGKMTWIDHHKSAIDEAKKRGFETEGLLRIGDSACELAWEFFSDDEMPLPVKLLGRYDVFDRSYSDRVFPFQYGARTVLTSVDSDFWEPIFVGLDNEEFVNDLVAKGKTILSYLEEDNKKYVEKMSFEFDLMGYKCISANRGLAGSDLFKAVYDKSKHDMMCSFYRMKNGGWSVSLYSDDGETDCSQIAKMFGGGGHKGAAGFQVKELEELFNAKK